MLGLFLNSNVPGKELKILKATASSVESPNLGPENAIDGNMATRWSSQFSDPQWITVDLGQKATIKKVILYWEHAYGKAYKIEVSDDGTTWKEVYSTTEGDGGKDEITFKPVSARYVRMGGSKRGTEYGYSLYEFEVHFDNLVLVSLPAPPSKEILKNPSFEKGATDWERKGNAGHIGVYEWQRHDGKFSYGIGNDNSPEGAYGEILQELQVPGEIKEADLLNL